MNIIGKFKYIGIIVFLLLVSNLSIGQVKYGPVLGVNMSSYDGSNLGLGIELGVFAKIEILDRFGWMPEVRFGPRSSTIEDATGVKTKFKMSAVDIYLISFYVPFSNNLNAWVGYRTSTYSNGTEQTAAQPENKIDIGSNKGLFVGLIYETVSGFSMRANASLLNVKDAGSFNTGGVEVSFTAIYAIDW